MKSRRIVRRIAGLAVAATLSLGVASPMGLAQYQPGGNPAALKKCKKKAAKKFKHDKAKKKQAIKKCKKKFG